MQYSQVQLANQAVGRLGARNVISSINPPDGPSAVKVSIVWHTIFLEVLSERDWKFAKTRGALAQSTESPLYGYQYAYALPPDFLRFVRPHKKPLNRVDWYWAEVGGCSGWYRRSDAPLIPVGFPYVVETQPDSGNKVILIDYDGSAGGPFINYIRTISDYSQLTPGFVNCFCWRLSQELALPITEDVKKFELCQQEYLAALNSATALNETNDYLENEAGNSDWVTAGRWWCMP